MYCIHCFLIQSIDGTVQHWLQELKVLVHRCALNQCVMFSKVGIGKYNTLLFIDHVYQIIRASKNFYLKLIDHVASYKSLKRFLFQAK
jgi:hypothetical protein